MSCIIISLKIPSNLASKCSCLKIFKSAAPKVPDSRFFHALAMPMSGSNLPLIHILTYAHQRKYVSSPKPMVNTKLTNSSCHAMRLIKLAKDAFYISYLFDQKYN